MILAVAALIFGLILLVWSADKFVDGAATSAKYIGISPLIIGMVIVGFGTSAPEMLVSALAAINGNSGIALGNAYGSNIANIALILGVSALIAPITIHGKVLKKELPTLVLVTVLSFFLLYDLELSRLDAFILLAVFFLIMGNTIYKGMKAKNTVSKASKQNSEQIAENIESEISEEKEEIDIKKSIFWLILGLALLIVSSRMLVWGAVEVAKMFNVSDIIIGLTVVAIGTSLPELASSIAAAKKNEHEIALGNVLGSNLFNTLAVVGIAGSIHPFAVPLEMLTRDMSIMTLLTLSLFLFGYAKSKKEGCITRFKGGLLVCIYVAYTVWLVSLVI